MMMMMMMMMMVSAVVDFPNLRAVDVIEEARQRILSTFRAYTTGLIPTSYTFIVILQPRVWIATIQKML